MGASWYSTDYKERVPVAVDFNAGTGSPSSAYADVQITVPKEWSRFWDNIRSDAFDVILTDHTGVEVYPTFQRQTFILGSKRLILQADNVQLFDGAMTTLYMYWNNPSAIDMTGSFSAVSPKTGHIFVGAPTGRIVAEQQNRAASDTPPTAFTKTVEETIWIWFYVGNLLGGRVDAYQKRKFFEGLGYVTVKSYDSSGTHSASRVVDAQTRFINGYIGAQFTGGSDGTDYTVGLEIHTTQDQIITPRALLQVRNMLPAS